MSLEQKRIINQFIAEFGFDPFSPTGRQDKLREAAQQDIRCECCGYMTHHREHLGCIRAGALVQQNAQAVQSRTCKRNLQVAQLLDDMLYLLPYNSPEYWIERIKEVRYKRDDHVEDSLDMVPPGKTRRQHW